MGWVKIDTSYLRNPKMAGLPDVAKLLHLASILWTAEHLQDGIIPPTAVQQLLNSLSAANPHRRRYVQLLVDRGLWDEAPLGYVVHDFAQHNAPSLRENVERERELSRQRMASKRERDRLYAVE